MNSHNFYTYVLKCIFNGAIYLELIVADWCGKIFFAILTMHILLPLKDLSKFFALYEK